MYMKGLVLAGGSAPKHLLAYTIKKECFDNIVRI